MRSSSPYTMMHRAAMYQGSETATLTPQVERIIATARDKEDEYQATKEQPLRDELDELMPGPAWGEV